jgi:hypothetical protein
MSGCFHTRLIPLSDLLPIVALASALLWVEELRKLFVRAALRDIGERQGLKSSESRGCPLRQSQRGTDLAGEQPAHPTATICAICYRR